MKVVGILAIICISLVCESVFVSGTNAGGQTSPAAAASRKVKILSANPALSRLYRLLSSRAGVGGDDEDLAGLEDESYFQKRQQYDDYGHMRFGKRNPKDFDDYGHMRFGKK